MTDGAGTWSWQYDSLHRLTSVTEGNNGTIAYQYDLRNLVTQVTYPGGHVVMRSHDDAGRNTATTDWLGNIVRFAYDRDSNLTSETFPTNAVGIYDQDTFAFNSADQMSSTTVTKNAPSLPPVPVWSASYNRDNNGQLLSDSSQLPTAANYGYTPLNQLCYAGAPTMAACSNPPPAATAYSFDKADNLVQNGSTQQSFNAADELCWTLSQATSQNPCGTVPLGATAYSYDSRGNRTATTPTSGSVGALGYDQANRLASWQQGSSSTTYTYNGDGLRTSKSVNGATENFQWDIAAGLPLLIGDNATQIIYGPDGLPIEQVNGSSALFFHHDQLGSTRVLTDVSGLVQATYAYDAYGNTVVASGTANATLRYAGRYQDAETGYYYLLARYYDPTTAQFLSRDAALARTGSPYGYAQNDPTNLTDPSGLDSNCSLIPNPFDEHSCIREGAGAIGQWVSNIGSDIAGLISDLARNNVHVRSPDYAFVIVSGANYGIEGQAALYLNLHSGHEWLAGGFGIATPGGGGAAGFGWVGFPTDANRHPSACQVDSFISGWTVEASLANIGYFSSIYSPSSGLTGYQIGVGPIERAAALSIGWAHDFKMPSLH
jgi:RHS repeat-associated protein